MDSTTCEVCHDYGYLDFNTHCDCPRGVYYKNNDELNLQVVYDELDIGYYPSDDDTLYDDDTEESFKLYLLYNLPFYDGMKVTDGTEYDDQSDYEYDDLYSCDGYISV